MTAVDSDAEYIKANLAADKLNKHSVDIMYKNLM